jgi:hypothetical protein
MWLRQSLRVTLVVVVVVVLVVDLVAGLVAVTAAVAGLAGLVVVTVVAGLADLVGEMEVEGEEAGAFRAGRALVLLVLVRNPCIVAVILCLSYLQHAI